MKGWLVNDFLTCIPGTKTLWHDLLEWLPLVDMTGRNYPDLPAYVEAAARGQGKPDYIVRNASYFPPLDIDCQQIVLVQDPPSEMQRAVVERATHAVFNTEQTLKDFGPCHVPHSVIPIGVDFDFWTPQEPRGLAGVAWVGANTEIKGIEYMQQIASAAAWSGLSFHAITKDGWRGSGIVRWPGRCSPEEIREIFSHCSVLLCTSEVETQHLAGIEAAACGLRIVTTRVGIWKDLGEEFVDFIPHGDARTSARDAAFTLATAVRKANYGDKKGVRHELLERGVDKDTCRKRWQRLINEVA